jgi:hypothetical protein
MSDTEGGSILISSVAFSTCPREDRSPRSRKVDATVESLRPIMNSWGMRESALNEHLVERRAPSSQCLNHVWRHSVIGVNVSLQLDFQSEGALVVGNDSHAKSGLHIF